MKERKVSEYQKFVKKMNKIAIFIKDFQKAAEISEKLVNLDLEIKFFESHNKDIVDYNLAVVDLNEADFGNTKFVGELRLNTKIFIIGYMSKIIKKSHDTFKSSGCDIILSNRSIVKNIESLVARALK